MIEQVKKLAIEDVKIIKPVKHSDERGFFSESYSKRDLKAHGINIDFVQDNHASSVQKQTLRGLHFQKPPYAQDKLIRVVKGKILDIAVDLRKDSKDYGKYVSAIISADEWNQIFIPQGFAHGLLTLEDNTEVLYKTSNYYNKESDSGIIWNDPILNIDWQIAGQEIILSEKDQNLANFNPNITYF